MNFPEIPHDLMAKKKEFYQGVASSLIGEMRKLEESEWDPRIIMAAAMETMTTIIAGIASKAGIPKQDVMNVFSDNWDLIEGHVTEMQMYESFVKDFIQAAKEDM